MNAGWWIKACLNGSRRPGDHAALPLAPAEVAADAQRVADAGAAAVHMHVRNHDGRQTLDPADVAATMRALRAATPGLPVGVSTGAWIEPDPERRLALVHAWDEQPDFASVNLSEDGAVELARLLIDRGVGVEAGLWAADDARALLAAGLEDACLRLLIEPRDRDPRAALATAAAIEAVLDAARVGAPRLLHGGGPAAWPLAREALRRGLQTRIGFEDTLERPDGRPATENADLVRAAVDIARGER